MADPIFQTNINEEWDAKTGKLKTSQPVQVDVTTEVVEYTLHDNANKALDNLRTIANGTGNMTPGQLTIAVRAMAKVLILLVRICIKKLDDIQ